jgi:hypothetical protein
MLRFPWNYHSPLGYLLHMVSRLASLIPNVHTLHLEDASGSSYVREGPIQAIQFDWEVEVGSKWPELINLTLMDYEIPYNQSMQHVNTEAMLQRLHTLDISSYSRFSYTLPSVMPQLQSLKVQIETDQLFQNLMTTLQSCKGSLHTLECLWP